MERSFNFQRFVLMRKYPVATVCAAITLLSLGAIFYLNGVVSDLENQRQMREHEGENSLAKLVSGPPLRAELNIVREARQRLDDNLVIEENLADNLWYFYKIEDQTGVRLRELRQVNGGLQFNSKFRRVPYEIDAVGTYAQIAHFLRAVETGSRLAKITSFALHHKEGGGTVIDAELTIELLGKHL